MPKKVKNVHTIPMKVRNGKVVYNKKVPKGYSYNQVTEQYEDSESIARKNPAQPKRASCPREQMYNFKHDIPPEYEPTEARRKREYLEWWEEQ